jgi:hypothetical protein
MFGGVEWLYREHRLVVLLRRVKCGVSASPNSFNLRRQSCMKGWYLEISSLGLLLPLPDFIDTDLK